VASAGRRRARVLGGEQRAEGERLEGEASRRGGGEWREAEARVSDAEGGRAGGGKYAPLPTVSGLGQRLAGRKTGLPSGLSISQAVPGTVLWAGLVA
jgi:hypothetical protein